MTDSLVGANIPDVRGPSLATYVHGNQIFILAKTCHTPVPGILTLCYYTDEFMAILGVWYHEV